MDFSKHLYQLVIFQQPGTQIQNTAMILYTQGNLNLGRLYVLPKVLEVGRMYAHWQRGYNWRKMRDLVEMSSSVMPIKFRIFSG